MILETLIISATGILADVVLKKGNLLLGMGLYAADAVMWWWVYKQAKFSTVAIIFSLFTILMSVIIGFLFFKEKVSTVEIWGIVLGIVSIVLLGRFGA